MAQPTETLIVPPGYPQEGFELDLLISRESLQERNREIAAELSTRFAGQNPVFVGVLNGAVLFLSDLIRLMTIPLEIDFLKIASYGDSTKSTGTIRVDKDLNADINGRAVVIVEDIVDTGLSLTYLKQHFESKSPSDIVIVTCLWKKEVFKGTVRPDLVGFEVPDRFVIGYGLDYAQQYRGLPDVYAFKEEALHEL